MLRGSIYPRKLFFFLHFPVDSIRIVAILSASCVFCRGRWLCEDAGVRTALSLPPPMQVSCYDHASSIDFIWPCADRTGPCTSWQRRVAGQLTASRDFLLSFKHYPFTKLRSPEIHTSPFSNDDLKSSAWKIDPAAPPASPQPHLNPSRSHSAPHGCSRLAVRALLRSKMAVG